MQKSVSRHRNWSRLAMRLCGLLTGTEVMTVGVRRILQKEVLRQPGAPARPHRRCRVRCAPRGNPGVMIPISFLLSATPTTGGRGSGS